MTETQTIDLALLGQLSADGRKSYANIANELGVSAGTVRNRAKRLIDAGTLTIIGRVNPNHVGFNAYATIHIGISPSWLIDSVVERVCDFPEATFVALVAGEYDLHVDVMCVNNDHLTELIRERVHHIPGVVDTKTMMLLSVHKYGQPDFRV